MLTLKSIIRTARPLLWLNTAVLWVLALLVLNQRPTAADIVMILYFTLPFNLWLHGINDLHDYESDRLNPRKGSDEGALLPPSLHAAILKAILWANLPFWIFALWQGTWLSSTLLGVFVFLGWAYSAPPLRGKSRPLLDCAINSAYILPFVIALAWHRAETLVWESVMPALLAFAAWAIASHAFTSIQDIEADRAAHTSTVATWLGARNTALFALFWYLLASVTAAYYGIIWGMPLLLYGGFVVAFLMRPTRERANRLYRWFIALNTVIGFVVTVTLALYNRANTVWAAIVVLSLCGLVLGALIHARYTSGKVEVAHERRA